MRRRPGVDDPFARGQPTLPRGVVVARLDSKMPRVPHRRPCDRPPRGLRGGGWLPALAVAMAGILGAAVPARADESAPPPQPFLYFLDGPARVYLFGTLHTNDVRVSQLHPWVLQAFEASDVLVGEIDLESEQALFAVERVLLPDGEDLRSHLSPALLERVAAHARRLDYEPDAVLRISPWALNLLFSHAVGGRGAGEGLPLDWLLFDMARKRNMPTEGLESAEEQIHVFERMSIAQQSRLLELVLEELEEVEAGRRTSNFELLVEAYASGDAALLRRVCLDAWQGDPTLRRYMEENLLESRDARMAQRLAHRARQRRDSTFFVAIGGAHLAGERGLLRRLRDLGWSVQRIESREEAQHIAASLRPAPRVAAPPQSIRRRVRPACPPRPCRPFPFGLPFPPPFPFPSRR